MKSNAFKYLLRKFKEKYGSRWRFVIAEYTTKEKISVRWINGHAILISDRRRKYADKLEKIDSEL